MFGRLYLLNHWCMLGIKEIPANKTCTSVPQEWHKPRGDSIEPEPVMKCSFSKASSDKDGKRKLHPVTCKLYDARGRDLRLSGWKQKSVMEMCQYLSNEEKRSPCTYLLSDQECSITVNAVFGNVPLGLALAYRLTDLKPNKTIFNFYCPDNSLLPLDQHSQNVLTFPKIPMLASCHQLFTLPEEFSDTTEPILQQININIEQAWHLQNITVAQAQDKRWVQEREIRLTASNFGKVLYRKKEPSESSMKSIFEPKDLSKVSSIQHDKHNEAIVRSLYARKMQKQMHENFTVYDCGLVVNPSHPYLGASPDGKVFDPSSTSPFGLLEIKCPYTWRNNSVEEACQDPNLPCAMINGVPRLKRDHKQGYYAQVQGQLALSGLPWCDFVVYLSGSHSLCVERIYFDVDYWNNTLLPKLTSFYFNHAIAFLKKKRLCNAQNLTI